MKLLIGGSPCTHWSIAQTKNRETEASGIGWELFLNYRIARDKYKPDFFLYENNKSMSPAIRAQITAELGVEPVLINSALVSAQNRQRLYWVGRRNPDGTYSQVPVEQPEDRGVCLLDVLTADDLVPYNGGEFKKLKAGLHAKFASTWQVGKTGDSGGQAVRVYDILGKSVTLKALAGAGGAQTGLYKIGDAIFALNAKGCEKLQTVPAGYTSCVPSNIGVTLLGNGWTVDVIAHIMSHFTGLTEKPVEVLSMYDGMSCGHIALDKLGAEITAYYATEIDKYAIQTTQHNFPDTVQLGDAFQVRNDDWRLGDEL